MGRILTRAMAAFALLAIGTSVAASALAGGEAHQIEIRVPAGQLRLLLVEQRGIDLLVTCREGAVANAPTGRLGYEAVLLEQDSRCQLSPKMAQAVRGMYRAEVLNPADAPLGMDTAGWRLYAGLLLLDDQVQGARQAAIAGFKELLGRNTLDQSFRLHLELAIGNLLRRTRESQAALEHYQRARQLATRGALRTWLPTIENSVGQAQIELRDIDAAETSFRKAESLAATQGNAYEQAAALNNQCLVEQHRGKIAQASDCYQAAIARYRAAGEIEQIATPLMNWASAAQSLGDPKTALVALTEARAIREGGPYDRSLGNVYLQLAVLHSRLAEWDLALATSLLATQVFDTLSEPASRSRALRVRAMALGRMGEDKRALSYARDALQAAQESRDPLVIAGATAELAELVKEPNEALRLHEQARDEFARMGLTEFERRHALLAARRMIDTGQIQAAEQILAQEPHALSKRNRALRSIALARLAFRSNAWVEALRNATDAESGFKDMRDHNGLREATEIALRASIAAQNWRAARLNRERLLDLHWHSVQNAPSPAQAAVIERAAKRLAEALLHWHQSSPEGANAEELLRSVVVVSAIPRWEHSGSHERQWQRYRFTLSRLQDARSDQERNAHLSELEELESQLEIGFSSNNDKFPRLTDAVALQKSLMPDQVFVAHLTAGRDAMTLVASHSNLNVLRAQGERIMPQIARHTHGFEQVHWLGLRGSLAASTLGSTQLVIRRVGPPPYTFSETQLDTKLPVALIALGDQSLPGVQRERAWLHNHYGPRLIELNGDSTELQLSGAQLLHVAAHGEDLPDRPLAAAVSESQSQSGSVLSIAQLRVQGTPVLIVLNVCYGGREQSVLSQAEQLALTTGATVVAPSTAVDDKVAFRFASILHKALIGRSHLQAIDLSLRELSGAASWRVIVGPAKRQAGRIDTQTKDASN